MFAIAKCFLLLLVVLPTSTVWGRLHEESEERREQAFTANQSSGGVAPFEFLNPTYYGNGCPKGSVRVIIPDFGEELTTVSVLFSEYIATTSGSMLRDRKSCNMALPVHVQPGLSVGIFKVDYRGNAYVPPSFSFRKPYARFDAEYFFAGQRGPIKSRTYTAPAGGAIKSLEHNFFETDTVGAIAWSACGGTTNFRINTSLIASKYKSSDEDPEIALDSKEIHQDGFYFAFQTRRC